MMLHSIVLKKFEVNKPRPNSNPKFKSKKGQP